MYQIHFNPLLQHIKKQKRVKSADSTPGEVLRHEKYTYLAQISALMAYNKPRACSAAGYSRLCPFA
jgi:hypothetical protein